MAVFNQGSYKPRMTITQETRDKERETETTPSPECQSKEWIDKVVDDTFNELSIRITSKAKLHPTERVNRDGAMAEYSNMKIYDFINSYHAYCKLCEQHFYSRSVASDINSFFQKHINTSYHRQIRAVCPPSDTTPIFVWEDKFQSGRCNLCDMSDLNSYIIDTELDLRKWMRLHICLEDQENRETNEKVLSKLNLLKKYCGLNIFRKKYIKTINGRGVCLLCMRKLPWSGEKANCHLSSDSHYQHFCRFLRVCFNFMPKDVLNGFNLEMITRWLIIRDPLTVSDFTDFDERKICYQYSNNEENPYSEEWGNFSFSSKLIQKLLVGEETDFIHNNECLLCNEAFEPGHMSSELHQSKAAIIDKMSFDVPEKYLIFCRKRKKRMRMIENYKRLKNEFENPPLPDSPKKGVVRPSQTSSQENYFKTMFKKKMDLVSYIFTVPKRGEIFCQLCDQYLSSVNEVSHLTSPHHKSQENKWIELRTHFDNERFTEPFQKVKNIILCLVCEAVFNPNGFFAHLKGGMHSQRFKWYCNQKIKIPISSSFAFGGDFFCFCTLCNTPMNKRQSFSSLKTTLKNIRHHWPCPQKKENKTDLSSELKTIFEMNKTVVEKNLNLLKEMSVPCSTCGRPFKEIEMKTHSDECTKNSVDFKKVEKTVESIVNVFEKKIMNTVLDRSASLLSSLHNLKMAVIKKEIKKSLEMEEPPTGFEDPSSGCNQSSMDGCAKDRTSEKQMVPESTNSIQKRVKISKKELRGKKTSNINDKKIQAVKDVEKENPEEKHEVLVIEGLPKSKRHYKVIYTKFSEFGKIRYVLFRKKTAIVAFADRSSVEVAARTPDIFKEYALSLTISKRKENRQTTGEPPSLNQDLIPLLQDLQALMDFSLDLIVQAISASESPLERKREELVCRTIISTILEFFPHGRCYPFGSRLSGLAFNNSDLDVFLDCGGMYEGFKNTTPCSERKLVNKVAKLLRKKPEITQIIVVDRARVPIVSFLHKPTLMRCDLSFKNGLSVQNTLLIKFMVSLDWRVRPLILFLKYWVKLNGLHGPPYFSSYAIAMLVIYYLEQLECPILPTIESLQNSYVGRRMTIGGWDCSINLNQQTLPKSENKEPFPKLLAELFEFYSKFDYEANVISPLTGKLLPREAFSSFGSEKLPMCYKRHILNIPTPIENLVNNKIYICIFDPFDLSYILTKSFTSRGLQKFIQLCKTSAEVLKKAISVSGSNNKTDAFL